MSAREPYLIWSHEHGAWWRPNSCGYTKKIEDAGRYSHQDALRICASFDWREDGTFPELPIREDDAISILIPLRDGKLSTA